MIDQHEKKIYERKSLADFHFVKVFWSIWLIVTTVLGPVSESGSELTMARIVALSGLSDLIYFLKHFEMHLIWVDDKMCPVPLFIYNVKRNHESIFYLQKPCSNVNKV